jgi:hypothetical protein
MSGLPALLSMASRGNGHIPEMKMRVKPKEGILMHFPILKERKLFVSEEERLTSSVLVYKVMKRCLDLEIDVDPDTEGIVAQI